MERSGPSKVKPLLELNEYDEAVENDANHRAHPPLSLFLLVLYVYCHSI
jgi:hypothetical protein